ncbi:MAG: DNA repair protein RecN [Clostridia bacterium]|nr:DNA repair protein RecN [Clostridia bacterium]NDO19858.1 DNA repair protein RecN [Lachnospiraceae bacterium MD329]
MLNHLSIKNVAVIDRLGVDFHSGVSVLTGETGAGKSIIIDSINMILGDRANKGLVRYGSDKAVVQAVFDADESVIPILEENDIDADDGQIVITRQLTGEGKSVARINGMVVTLNVLRDIADKLINIHGQHDSQALLTPAKHISFLDAYAVNDEYIRKYRECLKRKRETEKKIQSLEMDEQEKMRRIDLLEYQVDEISKAELEKGEDEELKEQREIYANAEQITGAVAEAYMNIYGGDEAAYDSISAAVDALAAVNGVNPKLKSMYEALSGVMYSLEDVAHEVKEFGDSVEFDEQALNDVEERLDLISKLKRKYGAEIEDILKYLETARKDLEDIKLSDERTNELKEELCSIVSELQGYGKELSKRRAKYAEVLEKGIEQSLHELNMERSQFKVNIETSDEFYENGMDRVEFLISTNPGEPLKPLVKIASGGELSRVMLAIKSILADSDNVDTLIFDEIDTGVSGRAAMSIAKKLSEIGRGKQVICITHLPQLTAAADNHYLIQKNTEGEMASTTLTELDGEQREIELARIIDGGEVTELALSHAREMLAKNAE